MAADSVWDMLAARRAHTLGVGVLSGGYGEDELDRAGATAADAGFTLSASPEGESAATARQLLIGRISQYDSALH